MKKILFLAFTISFIPFEAQAEDKLCRVLTLDVILMDTNDTFLQCRQGDALMIVENFVPRERTSDASSQVAMKSFLSLSFSSSTVSSLSICIVPSLQI